MTASSHAIRVIRHGWLFANQWVEDSADEIEEDDLTLRKRDQGSTGCAARRLTRYWDERGFEVLLELLSGSGAAETVGRYVVVLSYLDSRCGSISFAGVFPSTEQLRSKAERCLQGFLTAVDDQARAAMLQAAAEGLRHGR